MNIRKNFIKVLLLLFICFAAIPSSGIKTEAKPYMKTMKKLKWDLKKGKKYNTKLRIAGVGLKDYYVEMTKYKVSKADKYGMRTLTYTLKFTPNWEPTKAEVYRIVNSASAINDDLYEGYCMNLQPDYYSGYDLEYWEFSPVKIKLGEWKESNKKYYYDDEGGWYYTNVLTQTTKIRFPKTYKGLCIVIGTNHILDYKYADKEYLDGEAKFGKTSFYKKSWSSFHGLRVK